MRNTCVNVLSASAGASTNGSAIPTNQVVSASFQVYFSSNSAAGTFKIQASNDYSNTGTYMSFTPTHWVDIPNMSATISSGSSALITIANMCYQYIRVVYTDSTSGSATGTINAEMNTLSI